MPGARRRGRRQPARRTASSSSILAETIRRDHGARGDGHRGDAAAAAARGVREERRRRRRRRRSTAQGRWLLDADLIGGDARLPARTVWRFEVTRGAAERRLVLVDDHTGARADEHRRDRRTPTGSSATTPTSGRPTDVALHLAASRGSRAAPPARSPTSTPPTTSSGVVADFYQQVGGIDLTDLLGVTIGGVQEARLDRPLVLHRRRDAARTPTRSGTAPRCTTARGTPAPTTSSGTR